MAEKQQFERTMIVGGERLEIVVSEIAGEGWQLAVVNSLGVFSIWVEFFATPEIAFDTALAAIESEGVEEFVSVEGFEYLLEE